MSIAAAIANQTTPVEELGLRLVGRHIYRQGSLLELIAFEEGKLRTVIGTLTVEEATAALLPEPGTVVQLYGHEMIWLQPHTAQDHGLTVYVLVKDLVQERIVREAAQIVEVPDRPRESARTVELLMAQHQGFEQFKARLNAEANEFAEDNDLCEKYDHFMEEWGFNGRTHEYEAQIVVTLYRSVEGRDFEAATADIDGSDIKQWIADVDCESIVWEVEEQF